MVATRVGTPFFTQEELFVRNLLTDTTFSSKYSFFDLEKQRKLLFSEAVEEVAAVFRQQVDRLCKPIYRQAAHKYIDKFILYFNDLKLFPSMRIFQFSRMVPFNHTRLYNCSYTPVDSIESIAELFYLMLCGVGVGYSVEKKYISQLPVVYPEKDTRVTVKVEDSIEGWANALLAYLKSRFDKDAYSIEFDYSNVRKDGEIIGKRYNAIFGFVKGNPIREVIEKTKEILDKANYRKLKPIEVHDLITSYGMIINNVNVRGMAAIVFFDYDDEEMINCKNFNIQNVPVNRYYANNSIVLYRDGDRIVDANGNSVSIEDIFIKAYRDKSGEPGVFVTNDEHYRTNPCGEASLYKNFCNLTEIAIPRVHQSEIADVVNTAIFIGVLQATFTDFKFLRSVWKERTEEDALLGVSLTGIYEGLNLLNEYLKLSTRGYIKDLAAQFAKWFDINIPARITLVKPSGTVSLLAGVSPGCHPPYGDYFIRRNRISKDNMILDALKGYPFLIEDEVYQDKLVIEFPLRSRAHFDHDPVFQVNLRNKLMRGWVEPSHVRGKNTHNVSITLYVNSEKDVLDICSQLKHEKNISGLTILPVMENGYKLTPFEKIDYEKYEEMLGKIRVFMIENSDLIDNSSNPKLKFLSSDKSFDGAEAGCSGLSCYINF